MSATIKKRSILINRQKTSVNLEEPFWEAMNRIAGRREVSVASLIASLDRHREHGSSLSSVIREFVLADVRQDADQ